MSVESIRNTILEMQVKRPHQIYTHFQEGDYVPRNLQTNGFYFLIDNIHLDEKIQVKDTTQESFLEELASLKQFNKAIFMASFHTDRKNSNGKMYSPLSATVQKGYGESVEKSILLHLREQKRGTEIYTILGLLHLPNKDPYAHAWNVVIENKESEQPNAYLIDAQNHFMDKQTFVPCILPLNDIVEHRFKVKSSRKWNYSFAEVLLKDREKELQNNPSTQE